MPTVWSSDGNNTDFLYGKYFLDNTGRITLRFRFGKPLALLIPFIFCLMIPFPIFLYLLYDAVCYHELSLAPLLVLGLFSMLGFFGRFSSSGKTRQLLLRLLKNICNIEWNYGSIQSFYVNLPAYWQILVIYLNIVIMVKAIFFISATAEHRKISDFTFTIRELVFYEKRKPHSNE